MYCKLNSQLAVLFSFLIGTYLNKEYLKEKKIKCIRYYIVQLPYNYYISMIKYNKTMSAICFSLYIVYNI